MNQPTDDPRARLREALAAVLTGKAIGCRSKNDWTPTFVTQPWDAEYLVDAVLAVLPEHRDDVLALPGMEQTDSGLSYCTAHHGVIDCDETRCDFWDPDDDRCPYCDGDSVVQRTGPDAKPDEFDDCGACDGTGVTRCSPKSLFYTAASPLTKAQRHQEHYRTCGCLGDSDVCCDPLCCAEPAGEVAHDR